MLEMQGGSGKLKKMSTSPYQTQSKQTSQYPNGNGWSSVSKTLEEFAGYFGGHKGGHKYASGVVSGGQLRTTTSDDSPTSESSDHTLHMMMNRSASPVEYYPSPPESLPDRMAAAAVGPANYKAANYGITPLMAFIMGRRPSAAAIEKYIQSGADLNMQNDDGDTALHLACRHGHVDIAERLVKLGADLVTYNNAGLIPLHVAVCANHTQIVRMMLEYCRSMSDTFEQIQQQQQQQQQQGQVTPSSQLIVAEQYNIIDVKADCVVGDTSLIMAVKNNSIEMLQLLIEFKANVNAVDNDGLSPLHYCAKV